MLVGMSNNHWALMLRNHRYTNIHQEWDEVMNGLQLGYQPLVEDVHVRLWLGDTNWGTTAHKGFYVDGFQVTPYLQLPPNVRKAWTKCNIGDYVYGVETRYTPDHAVKSKYLELYHRIDDAVHLLHYSLYKVRTLLKMRGEYLWSTEKFIQYENLTQTYNQSEFTDEELMMIYEANLRQ